MSTRVCVCASAQMRTYPCRYSRRPDSQQNSDTCMPRMCSDSAQSHDTADRVRIRSHLHAAERYARAPTCQLARATIVSTVTVAQRALSVVQTRAVQAAVVGAR
jgi:hypothetical protein